MHSIPHSRPTPQGLQHPTRLPHPTGPAAFQEAASSHPSAPSHTALLFHRTAPFNKAGSTPYTRLQTLVPQGHQGARGQRDQLPSVPSPPLSFLTTMASAFVLAAKNIIRELSKDGELIPVDSLKSSFHFSPYSLVRKKTRSSLFWRSQYVCLNLTLKDILDPNSPEPEVTQLGPFHFNDEADGKVSGTVKVTASIQGKISAQISESNKTTIEVKVLTVSPTSWDCLQKERKLKIPEPSIFQQLRERGENLYVVTEAVKTQKEAILKRSRNRGGFGKMTIPGASCIQGEGQGHLNTVKTVTVPEGSILAFQVAKLIIQDQWSVLLLPDKNQNTFPLKGLVEIREQDNIPHAFFSHQVKPTASCIEERSLKSKKVILPPSRKYLQRDASPEIREQDRTRHPYFGNRSSDEDILPPSCKYFRGDASLDFNTVTDFEQLEAEVKSEQRPLTMLDGNLEQSLLQALQKLLKSEQDMLNLEDMLEQSLYTGESPKKVKGMAHTIIKKLQNQNGQLMEEEAGAFLYLLGALNALSDCQHQVLIQLLQKKEKILSQEVDLVKEILKENFNQTEERTFSLPSKLLSFVQAQDENLTLTRKLLGECGLWITGDEPQITWNPSALQSLCALYGSLLMLQALNGAC
ncbi:gasdermin-D-like [Petaurus breviceps papuanus]|uniref:gasdermin-D-like n=1 Tax=Petaurus breviceps papuanus TaxID=3040969 RepID=UPI0036D98CF3